MAEKCAPMTTMSAGQEPHPRPQAVAAEQHQAQEAALEEEGEDAFRRQQRAEDVAHEPGVVGPVHAELELLDDARGHAHGEDDAVDLDPEEREAAPLGVPGAQVEAAHHEQHQAQAHAQGREDEVVAGGQRELQSRQQLGIQGIASDQGSAMATAQPPDRGGTTPVASVATAMARGRVPSVGRSWAVRQRASVPGTGRTVRQCGRAPAHR